MRCDAMHGQLTSKQNFLPINTSFLLHVSLHLVLKSLWLKLGLSVDYLPSSFPLSVCLSVFNILSAKLKILLETLWSSCQHLYDLKCTSFPLSAVCLSLSLSLYHFVLSYPQASLTLTWYILVSLSILHVRYHQMSCCVPPFSLNLRQSFPFPSPTSPNFLSHIFSCRVHVPMVLR